MIFELYLLIINSMECDYFILIKIFFILYIYEFCLLKIGIKVIN